MALTNQPMYANDEAPIAKRIGILSGFLLFGTVVLCAFAWVYISLYPAVVFAAAFWAIVPPIAFWVEYYLILTIEGRMMTIITRADRKPATSVDERAALLDSMVSYTGRYRVEHNRIIIRPDVAWNEIYSGTEQIRYYTLNGDKLSIRTAEQLSAVLPGKKVVGTLTYEREGE
jgi:hypothetical protein